MVLLWAVPAAAQPRVAVSSNHRFLQTTDGKPFFWLGDTAWLLFQKLDRAETERYLDNRQEKGFNVLQCMVLHAEGDTSAYGTAALLERDPARPNVTPGNDPERAGEYDYWDHVDWVVGQAAQRGIYIAMVPAWGSIVRSGRLNAGNVQRYVEFLADRYRGKPNIFWLVGGDTRGDRETDVWQIMGETLRQRTPRHLVTFHPFGRTQSSAWFHEQSWLDFNMFQSGHRRYNQDATGKGEDNWRYVQEDYRKKPPKPTIDGEPSYEGIPQGLHDPAQPRWTDSDVRRYAYWSVFAGSFGHTYGNNSVIQMYKPGKAKPVYGATEYWDEAMDDPGAGQMQHLKRLMLSHPFFDRMPDQAVVAGENGERYDRVIATRGRSYALLYTYSGKKFGVKMGAISGQTVRTSWYDPRTGNSRTIGTFPNSGTREFDPPGEPAPGNDWVLVLEDTAVRSN
jgi:hypothetical protein